MKEPLLRRSAFDIVIMQAYIHATHSLSRRQIRRKDRLSVMRACSYWRGAKYLHAGRESEQERERERAQDELGLPCWTASLESRNKTHPPPSSYATRNSRRLGIPTNDL